MTQHNTTEYQNSEAQNPTPEQIEEATAQILDAIKANPEHDYSKALHSLQDSYVNKIWNELRTKEGLRGRPTNEWPTGKATEDEIKEGKLCIESIIQAPYLSSEIWDGWETLVTIPGGPEAMLNLVFEHPENAKMQKDFDRLGIAYTASIQDESEEPLLGFSPEMPTSKAGVFSATMELHANKQSQRERKAVIGRKGLRYFEAVEKLTDEQADHLSGVREEAIEAFQKLAKEKGKKADVSPVIGGILERLSKSSESGLSDQDRSQLREVLNRLHKSNLWEDKPGFYGSEKALQDAQEEYDYLKELQEEEKKIKEGLTTRQKVGRFLLTTVYEGAFGVFVGRLFNKAAAYSYAYLGETREVRDATRALALVGRLALTGFGAILLAKYGHDIADTVSGLFDSADTAGHAAAEAPQPSHTPDASEVPTSEVSQPNPLDTTLGDTPGIDSVPESSADTQPEPETTQPTETTVETQIEKEETKPEVKEHTEPRLERDTTETPQHTGEEKAGETPAQPNVPEAHLSTEQLEAFTIPEGGTGEILMQELGVDPKEWYKISGDLPQLFPDEFYGVDVPEGFTDVRFKQPGTLSPEAIQTISSRLGLWK